MHNDFITLLHIHIIQVLESYEESGPTLSYKNEEVVSFVISKIYKIVNKQNILIGLCKKFDSKI